MNIDSLFSHEFTLVPLTLCDYQDTNLLNQQQKSEIFKLFENECSTEFSTSDTATSNSKWILTIDNGPLPENRPSRSNGSIFDYAKQLLQRNVIPEFKKFHRIDVVVDADRSKLLKLFTKRNRDDKREV